MSEILALYPELPCARHAAGHKTSLAILTTLANFGHRITLLAFDYGGVADPAPLRDICSKVVLLPMNRRDKLFSLLSHPLLPAFFAERYMKSFIRLIDAHIGQADAVHVEFSQMLPYVARIRRQYADKRICFVSHDVIAQKSLREAKQRNFLDPLRDIELVRTLAWEQRLLSAADRVIVQSGKDARLLSALGDKVAVIPPRMEQVSSQPVAHGSDAGYILFFGAMSREENWRAALDFAAKSWLTLHARYPEIGFVIAGSNPPAQLTALSGHNGITVSGFVEDPVSLLAGARLTVAPITLGAGIKVKVLESLQVGCPVVALPAGAEGIELSEKEGLFVVADFRVMTERVLSLLAGDVAVDRVAVAMATRKAFDWSNAEQVLAECYGKEVSR